MISYKEFCDNCARLRERVENACAACARSADSVKILPVTKTHPAEAAEYSARCGFKAVGENRVQEAVEKITSPAGKTIAVEWELIGHLQSNKAKHAAQYFARVQSADSQKLLNKLNEEAEKLGKTLRVLLQVNAGRDAAKFGAEIEDAPALLEFALSQKNIAIEGLMTVAPLDSNLDSASACFANLRNLRDGLEKQFSHPLPELSMGMSGDLERAIAEGSTLVRVGTFLFGERDYSL